MKDQAQSSKTHELVHGSQFLLETDIGQDCGNESILVLLFLINAIHRFVHFQVSEAFFPHFVVQVPLDATRKAITGLFKRRSAVNLGGRTGF